MAGYDTTHAQEAMRADIEASNQRKAQERVSPEPASLGMTLDDVFGKQGADADVAAHALGIIKGSPDLVLNLSQWHIVQTMVEDAIRRGIALAR